MKNFILLVLILQSTFSIGQNIVTDRPTQTTGPTNINKGIFQLESGLVYSRVASNGGFNLSNLFRIGLSNRFELRASNGLRFSKQFGTTIIGFNQFELGTKFEILNKPEGNTQIGIISHGQIRTGLDNLEWPGRGVNTTLAFNHNLNSKNSLSYNLGYSWYGTGLGSQTMEWNTYYMTLNYGHSFTDRLGLFAEFYGSLVDLSVSSQFSESANVDMGITYLIMKNFQIDYSFGFGLLDEMNFHSLGLSFYVQPDK